VIISNSDMIVGIATPFILAQLFFACEWILRCGTKLQRFQVQFLSHRLHSFITIFFTNYNSLKLKLKQVLQHLDWEPMVLTFSNPKTLLTKMSLSALNFFLIHFHF